MDINKNLFLAKKYMVENIYNAANIEGIAMTFPETQTICDGMSVAGKSVDDINAVCDLKRAYQWIFANIEEDICLETVKMINRYAGRYTVINAGRIRSDYDEPIRVMVNNGNYYYPPIPKAEEELNSDIVNILSDNSYRSCLELFCYLCKSQLFNDGNKRTATLATGMAMIQRGYGLFAIPATEKQAFYQKLAGFYENDDNREELISFLSEKCVTYNNKRIMENNADISNIEEDLEL